MPTIYYDKYELIDILTAAGASKIALKILDEPLVSNGSLHRFIRVDLSDYETEHQAFSMAKKVCDGDFGFRGDIKKPRQYFDGLQEIFKIIGGDEIYVRISW